MAGPILAKAKGVFQPAMKVIIGITNANPAVVTTSINGTTPAAHNYMNELIVRLDIPQGYGMQQLNQLFGPITVLTSTTFSIPIDTTHLDAFSFPSNWPYTSQYAQVVPFAENSDTLLNAVQNYL